MDYQYEDLIIKETYSFDTEDELDLTYSSDVDVEVDESGEIFVVPHHWDPLNPHTQRQLIGATIAGALAGCFACGPLLGLPVGAGVAAIAVSSDTKVGEWTRKGGDAVAKAGVNAGERIQHLEEEYHLVDKTKDTAVKGCEWTKEHLEKFDEEHHLVDKTKEGAIKSYEWASRRLEPNDSPRAALE